MTTWFTNKGQIVQSTAAVLSCALTLISFLRQGVSVAWLIASGVLLAVVAISAYLSLRAAYRRRRSVLLRLFRQSRDHAAAYRELMRRFPTSPAVASPWDTTWRPDVGQTQIRTDYDKVIDWADATRKLLIHTQATIGDCTDLAHHLKQAHSPLEVVNILNELDERILVTIDAGFAPAL